MIQQIQADPLIEAFMEEVRRAQRASGKALHGRAVNSPHNSVCSGIMKRTEGGAARLLTGESSAMIDAVDKLAVRFDEMCRRQGAHHLLTEKMSADIVQRLAWELKENCEALGSSRPEKFISVTLYNGAIAPRLLLKNAFFKKAFAVHRACELRPLDPQSFLTEAKKKAQELMKRSEDPQDPLCVFKDAPSMFVHAVVAAPNDPLKHLKKHAVWREREEDKRPLHPALRLREEFNRSCVRDVLRSYLNTLQP